MIHPYILEKRKCSRFLKKKEKSRVQVILSDFKQFQMILSNSENI